MSRTSALFCAWSGPVFFVAFAVGFIGLAGFVPPPSPHESATAVAHLFRTHQTAIRGGMALAMFGVVPLAAWGVGLAALTAHAEGSPPALAWIQVTCVAMGVLTGVLDMTVWAVAAFRADQLNPETLRLLNDLGWFLFLFPISPFCLWLVAVGLAILLERAPQPTFPRWSAYLSFLAAVLFIPAGMIFSDSGLLAWNGLLGFYVPMVAYFVWDLTMNVLVFRAVGRLGAVGRRAVPELV